MKSKEELNALKEEINKVNEKICELTPEELEQVTGGARELTHMWPKPFTGDVLKDASATAIFGARGEN